MELKSYKKRIISYLKSLELNLDDMSLFDDGQLEEIEFKYGMFTRNNLKYNKWCSIKCKDFSKDGEIVISYEVELYCICKSNTIRDNYKVIDHKVITCNNFIKEVDDMLYNS